VQLHDRSGDRVGPLVAVPDDETLRRTRSDRVAAQRTSIQTALLRHGGQRFGVRRRWVEQQVQAGAIARPSESAKRRRDDKSWTGDTVACPRSAPAMAASHSVDCWRAASSVRRADRYPTHRHVAQSTGVVGGAGAAPLSVGAVLRAVAADGHRAPCRRSVLGAIEKRVGAVPARLQPRPRTRDLGFVNDHEQHGHGGIDAAVRWHQKGGGVVAEVDSYGGRPSLASELCRHGWVEVALSVRHS
jgi:hypothetical protein